MTTKLMRSGKIIIYFSLLLYTLYLKLINNILHSSISFFEEVNVKVNFLFISTIITRSSTTFYILFDKSIFFQIWKRWAKFQNIKYWINGAEIKRSWIGSRQSPNQSADNTWSRWWKDWFQCKKQGNIKFHYYFTSFFLFLSRNILWKTHQTVICAIYPKFCLIRERIRHRC